MSVQAMTWAFEQNVEPNAKLVLLALANRANHETGVCYPGQELLARECSMSDRTVRRHLKTLEDRGLITRRTRMLPEGRGRSSDEYRLAYYQADRMSGRSRPTGQNGTTNRTNQDDQPDTVVQVTVREPKENPKVVSQRLTSMTADWQPTPENITQLTGKHPTIRLDDELEQFRDYWISKGERRADWNAGFRTWVRNAAKWQKDKPEPGKVPHLRKKAGPNGYTFCQDCGSDWEGHDTFVCKLTQEMRNG